MKRLLLIAVLLFAAWKGYEHLSSPLSAISDSSEPISPSFQAPATELTTAPAPTFQCDGRQHCSQMNSRAEAEFFVRNCPDTKMDGDRDGDPCENDSRF